MVFRNSTLGELAYICQSKLVGTVAMKIEWTGIHFLGDVFAAIAVTDLSKVPTDITIRFFTKTVKWVLEELIFLKGLFHLKIFHFVILKRLLDKWGISNS